MTEPTSRRTTGDTSCLPLDLINPSIQISIKRKFAKFNTIPILENYPYFHGLLESRKYEGFIEPRAVVRHEHHHLFFFKRTAKLIH